MRSADLFSMLFMLTLTILKQVSAESIACGGKPADIIFVIDSSASITKTDFEKQLNFTREVVEMFDVGGEKTRVGLISFSSTVVPELGLNSTATKDDVLQSIGRVKYLGGGTNTGEALKFVHKKLLSSARKDVPHIIIVLTDGMSYNINSTTKQAELARKDGITAFVIGIGNQVDKAELEGMASSPSSKYMFLIDSFDALTSIKEALAVNTCEVEVATKAPEVEQQMVSDVSAHAIGKCSPNFPVELTFAVDSAAIGSTSTQYVLQMISDVTTRFDLALENIRVSAISSGCSEGQNVFVDSSFNQTAIQIGLHSAKRTGFQRLMRDTRLTANQVARKGATKVGILFLADNLDGEEYAQSMLESRRATFQRQQMFIVGVGDRVNTSQARTLAPPGHYMYAIGYDMLGELETPLLMEVCNIKRDV